VFGDFVEKVLPPHGSEAKDPGTHLGGHDDFDAAIREAKAILPAGVLDLLDVHHGSLPMH
jgi:hypothetical protein